ncbi:MAG: hypothetical protein IT554_00290 [Sphingomonadaceae bacterium]|nr:hypothetical protein [Sphingomonadaceae bacterium]
MPKGPQGHKRPANVVSNAVTVAKVATGEIDEEVDYATSKSIRGSAGGKARAKHLSNGERSQIAKAGAKARWKKGRSADMTSQDRLMAALFDNPQREHADIKFFVMGGMDLTAEQLCDDAAEMLEQMDNSEGDTTFTETFAQRDVKEFIASI